MSSSLNRTVILLGLSALNQGLCASAPPPS